jgi:hypothetical protein
MWHFNDKELTYLILIYFFYFRREKSKNKKDKDYILTTDTLLTLDWSKLISSKRDSVIITKEEF